MLTSETFSEESEEVRHPFGKRNLKGDGIISASMSPESHNQGKSEQKRKSTLETTNGKLKTLSIELFRHMGPRGHRSPPREH